MGNLCSMQAELWGAMGDSVLLKECRVHKSLYSGLWQTRKSSAKTWLLHVGGFSFRRPCLEDALGFPNSSLPTWNYRYVLQVLLRERIFFDLLRCSILLNILPNQMNHQNDINNDISWFLRKWACFPPKAAWLFSLS